MYINREKDINIRHYLTNGGQVEVKVLKQVPQATQVMVEPASPDDWEIVVPRRKQLFCPYRVVQ